MNDSPLSTFITLINFDRSLAALEKEYNALTSKLNHIKIKETSLLDDVEHAKKAVHAAQKEVDAIELDMKTLDQQEASKKNRLENVISHKEYQSVKAEIDILKTKQHDLEKKLLEAWSALETATKVLHTKKESSVAAIQELHTQEQQIVEQQKTVQNRINDDKKLRPEKEKNVPAEWLEKYASMRSRVEDPVVPVINGNCSACFYKISDQDLVLLRRNKLMQCKDCYRFLYIEKPEQQSSSTTPHA